ncbi:hypothetical protein MPLDJ20_60525 [Mesorhizobium plurifarium]|uniref:Uncharacterized protein n=1 Tax=Mesorhizobium plurifarium TaxID=69974 RepID=A0A090GQH4_MESPL|nr:hypothetical protein MPLDJ20_60525 [Mesorhizobium plurifarium]
MPFLYPRGAIFPFASDERKHSDPMCFELFANNNHLMA